MHDWNRHHSNGQNWMRIDRKGIDRHPLGAWEQGGSCSSEMWGSHETLNHHRHHHVCHHGACTCDENPGDRRSRSHSRGHRSDWWSHGGCGNWVPSPNEIRRLWRAKSVPPPCPSSAQCLEGLHSFDGQYPTDCHVTSRRSEVSYANSNACSEGGRDDMGDDASASATDTDQEEIVHFDWECGAILNSRYKLVRLLGDGTFGRVLLANDLLDRRDVALKIIRDVKRYMENAKVEADILSEIHQADPRGKSRCAVLYDTFTHARQHFCLVFEPLGVSLYDFLKSNDFQGYWMQDIQSFSRQFMQALMFLHDHVQMTHTDLKPENILLQSLEPPIPSHFPRSGIATDKKQSASYLRPRSSRIKLIDFGNATRKDEHHSSIINTRQYRGPEVLLACGWDYQSDIWSIGCILMELYTGEQLFATHEELEHLALIERILGPFSNHMLGNAGRAIKERYLSCHSGCWQLCWPKLASSSSERHVRSQKPLKQQVVPTHRNFCSFVDDLLTVNPVKRPPARNALAHIFLSEVYQD